MQYILASASPRRYELLQNMISEFTVLPSDAPEIIPADCPIFKAPEKLALQKAAAIAKKHPEALVIGADTGVFIDGQMLGKPNSRVHAKQMLKTLSGRTHKVITGCALCLNGKEISFSETTEVTFYDLNDTEIDEYIATGESDDKAGAYGIQQKGALLVKKINGDYFNVVGLPIARLSRVVQEFTK